jgi:fumarylpyruvate hydrolase
MTEFPLWAPPAPVSLPVKGLSERAAVNRIFCVGRNYLAHAAEMGHKVEKEGDRPFYFTKSPQALVESGATIPYPPETRNCHHEMELVVVIGAPGFRVAPERAHELIYGYACGLDLTRRDLQLAAREKGRPWDLGKDFENAAVVSEIVPMPGVQLERGWIKLLVNGAIKQKSDLGNLIWSVREIVADLSLFYHLAPGDLIFTGTPDGVGPVKPGDKLEGKIEGVGTIALTIGPAEA